MRSPVLSLARSQRHVRTLKLPHLFFIAVRLKSLHHKPIRETPNGPPPHQVRIERGAKLVIIQRNSGQDKRAVEFAVAANLQNGECETTQKQLSASIFRTSLTSFTTKSWGSDGNKSGNRF